MKGNKSLSRESSTSWRAWRKTTIRVFVGLNLLIIVGFYVATSSFHGGLSHMDESSSHTSGTDAHRHGRMLGAQEAKQQPQLLTLADPNGDARAIVSGASQAEAHLKELHQPQDVRADKAVVAEQTRFYTGPLDVDEATMKLAMVINQTYWDDPSEKTWWNKPGYHLSYMEDYPPYPYQRIKSEDGKDTGVVALIAPFYDLTYYRAEMARAMFWRMKANGQVVIGISSYQEFPGQITNPFDDRHTTEADWEIYKATDGWLHCFREPDQWIPPGVPRVLLSESDFHNPERRDDGGSLQPWGLEKLYDVAYSNQGGEWNDWARNWTLAKPSFIQLIAETNATVLILGRDLTKEEDLQPLIASGNIVSHEKALWRDFLKLIEQSRSLVTFNVHDASPRVLAEAMCMDVPVLINWHILGGWKYATEQTGEDFVDTASFIQAYKRLREPERKARLRPRQWYRENSGYYRASLQLQAFLHTVVGDKKMKSAKQLMTDRHAEP
ncbi:TPA: hypothetical protein ACH3X3_004097 [Trebouxia sp. C0006]